ncbi:MAG: hypothetical protein DRO88_11605 [Promethearchaeia archaeon]|nr:MAG: hypothetical protein DRO88_11605 [Candidatus Lokiarchaeia archaeon]
MLPIITTIQEQENNNLFEKKNDNSNPIYTSMVKCPMCHQNLTYHISNTTFCKIRNFPSPHALIHGEPSHALIIYLDQNRKIRAFEIANSVEIL